jgi:prepilin-type processing-associated H-X9-DG protein
MAIGIPLGVLGLLFLFCTGCLFPFDFAFFMIAGWIFYLVRVVPQITLNWSGILTAVVCLAALAFGLQRFLAWFYKQMPARQENAVARIWSWRWTLRILAIVVLMFVAGISAIGITHQTSWLFTSPEPFFYNSRDGVNRAISQNNLHQITLDCHNYEDSFGHLPAGAIYDSRGNMLHGWPTLLLPYMEQDNIYRQINLKLPWTHPDNAPAFRSIIKSYLNPGVDDEYQDSQEFCHIHYAANARVIGGDRSLKLADITDGTSNTILGGEVNSNFKPWGYPANWRDPALGINKSPDSFGAPWTSKKVCNFVFADGSVRPIKEDIDPATLKALSTPNGGEIVDFRTLGDF